MFDADDVCLDYSGDFCEGNLSGVFEDGECVRSIGIEFQSVTYGTELGTKFFWCLWVSSKNAF